MTKKKLPKREDLLWPALKALEALGGSASIQELSERMVLDLRLPDSVLDIPHKSDSRSAFDYNAAWARTDLKMVGLVTNSLRGVWVITELGRSIHSEKEVCERVRQARAEHRETNKDARGVEAGSSDYNTASEQTWVDDLLEILRKIDPNAFERLCQRVLREAGFNKVEVTERTRDGGIDGTGVLRVNLLSFRVAFQCKRYSGSVPAPEIQKFQGAMSGRADKGLFITTGRFTRDAEKAAVRDGALAIDLIDGIELCSLLKERDLGVMTKTKEFVELDREFFEKL